LYRHTHIARTGETHSGSPIVCFNITPEAIMSEPTIAQKAPFEQELDAGTYWWCACGKSQNQPFCDGSHKGTDFEPVKFELAEKTKVWLCGCKHSSDRPFCDGSHKKI
jgi:CDGSH-type Zn-finger protein